MIIPDKKYKINLIEDNLGDTKLIEAYLTENISFIYELTISSTLKVALKNIKKKSFDIVLLDLNLPDSRGLDTVLEVLNVVHDIPIIVLTGLDEEFIAIKSLKKGIQDYIVKDHLNCYTLTRAIKFAIERKKIEQKLKNSEKTSRLAYNRAEFYKDLFTHDINNILQGILFGIELNKPLINEIGEFKNFNKNLLMIKAQVMRAAKLVSNIRKLSLLEKNEQSIKNIDANSLLELSINVIVNSFKDRKILIERNGIKDKVSVRANSLLTDVYENILLNSIMHNINPSIMIEIRISKEKYSNEDCIKFEFIDNGIGIDDKSKNKVFQRSKCNDDRSIHGRGLGLSLVKKIIDSYNGKIWIENRIIDDYTRGSNFCFILSEVKREIG